MSNINSGATSTFLYVFGMRPSPGIKPGTSHTRSRLQTQISRRYPFLHYISPIDFSFQTIRNAYLFLNSTFFWRIEKSLIMHTSFREINCFSSRLSLSMHLIKSPCAISSIFLSNPFIPFAAREIISRIKHDVLLKGKCLNNWCSYFNSTVLIKVNWLMSLIYHFCLKGNFNPVSISTLRRDFPMSEFLNISSLTGGKQTNFQKDSASTNPETNTGNSLILKNNLSRSI